MEKMKYTIRETSILFHLTALFSFALGSCPDLNPPQNGMTSGQCIDVTFGARCSFQCMQTLVLTGQPTVTCTQSGTWDYPRPKCDSLSAIATVQDSVKFCSTLYPPGNGVLSGNCGGPYTPTGGICAATCNPGFSLVGSNSLVCSQDGTWNGQVPTCTMSQPQRMQSGTMICPDQVAPTGGIAIGRPTQAKPGEVVFFSCYPGFRLVGMASLRCSDQGQWIGPPPFCQQGQCPTLNMSAKLTSTCQNPVPIGSVCSFQCLDGMQLLGSMQANCTESGQWSNLPPVCEHR